MTSEAIQLPQAPGIHGLRFRRFRAGADFRHMSTILRVSAEVDDTERANTPEFGGFVIAVPRARFIEPTPSFAQ